MSSFLIYLIGKQLDKLQTQVDKDIQVIQDYQTQSLANLSKDEESFKQVEERLSLAVEEPLTQLKGLYHQAEKHKSIQQASEWVAKLQEKRENYFDQLLMKIDHVMKDVVHIEENGDGSGFVEVEGEILFMERELHHINGDLTHCDLLQESDQQFLLARLEGLLDHMEDLDKRFLSMLLKNRLENVKSGVLLSISRLNKSKI